MPSKYPPILTYENNFTYFFTHFYTFTLLDFFICRVLYKKIILHGG